MQHGKIERQDRDHHWRRKRHGRLPRPHVRRGRREGRADRHSEGAGAALAEELGPDAAFIRRDVSNTEDRFGPANVLVNNAGVVREAPISELSDADFDFVTGVNQRGVFLGSRAILPKNCLLYQL